MIYEEKFRTNQRDFDEKTEIEEALIIMNVIKF
jgi:hypothetical protein